MAFSSSGVTEHPELGELQPHQHQDNEKPTKSPSGKFPSGNCPAAMVCVQSESKRVDEGHILGFWFGDDHQTGERES